MSNFKPLLASDDFNLDDLDYSNLLMSPKLDGIRAIVIDGVVLSRSLKPIPNPLVQKAFGDLEFFDGELVCGDPTSKSVYQDTFSAVMTKKPVPIHDVRFHAFDHIEKPGADYLERLKTLGTSARGLDDVVVLPQLRVNAACEVRAEEDDLLSQGYEGAMLRAAEGPNSAYKFGRSTGKQQTLLKLKRFSDDEAEVVGFLEEMHNNNEAVTDALGHTKRSSHAENKVGKGRLGALVCRTPEGVEFQIGTGFTAAQRLEFWLKREALLGSLAKYKHFKVGAVVAPRFPVFLGFRDTLDT